LQIELTEADDAAIQRLQGLGFERVPLRPFFLIVPVADFQRNSVLLLLLLLLSFAFRLSSQRLTTQPVDDAAVQRLQGLGF
jgi:hypothetical protein